MRWIERLERGGVGWEGVWVGRGLREGSKDGK